MRPLRPLLLLVALLLATAVASDRAHAAALPFTGTLTLRICPPGSPPDFPVTFVTATGSGVASAAGTGHPSSFLLAGGTFGPITTRVGAVSFATGGAMSLVGIENQAGSFSGAGGVMGLSGLAKICLFFDQSCNFLFGVIPIQNLGIGGTSTGPGSGPYRFTIQHAPWTRGQPAPMTIHHHSTSITTPDLPNGFAHGPASGTSSTALPGGTLQMVTVSKAYSGLTVFAPEMPMWGVLNLHFVPEPPGWLLSASAIALLYLGRRTRSNHRDSRGDSS